MLEVLPHDCGIDIFPSHYLIDNSLITRFMEDPKR